MKLIHKQSRLIRRMFGETVEQRRESMGYVFILLWLIGVVWFFLIPFIQAIMQMFYKVELGEDGISYTYIGLRVFQELFLENSKHIQTLTSSLGDSIIDSFLIVIFSLIVAVLLNRDFRGRGLIRAIMALPIIVSSGVLMQVFKGDLFLASIESSAEATVFQGVVVEDALLRMGLNDTLVNTISSLVAGILDLIWQCGIQILLFIGGMQSVPRAYYEVCQVEGASPWQSFWRITFPLITPFVMLNFVYAVIDSFTMPTNQVIISINEYFHNVMYSHATALSFSYFILVLLVVGIIYLLISRRIFYIEK